MSETITISKDGKIFCVDGWELWNEKKLPSGIWTNILGYENHIVTGSPPYRSPTYQSWYGAVAKQYYESHTAYLYYGALGTRTCHRWVFGDGVKCGFLCFLEDMGERPEGMTLDRINPYGHYTPDNCRWADAETQANNKRYRRKVA